jgi:hypothetical protein
LIEDGEYKEYVPRPYDETAAKAEHEKMERARWVEIPGLDVDHATSEPEQLQDVANTQKEAPVAEKEPEHVPLKTQAKEKPRHPVNPKAPAKELDFEDLMAAVDKVYNQVQENQDGFKLPPRQRKPEPERQPTLGRDRIGSADELHSIKAKGGKSKKQPLEFPGEVSSPVLKTVPILDDEVSIADHIPYTEAQLQALEIDSQRTATTPAQKKRFKQIWKEWKQNLKSKARDIKLKLKDPKLLKSRPQSERAITMHPITFHV